MQGLNVCHHKPLLTVCGRMCMLIHLARCMIWSAGIPQALLQEFLQVGIISCLESDLTQRNGRAVLSIASVCASVLLAAYPHILRFMLNIAVQHPVWSVTLPREVEGLSFLQLQYMLCSIMQQRNQKEIYRQHNSWMLPITSWYTYLATKL